MWSDIRCERPGMNESMKSKTVMHKANSWSQKAKVSNKNEAGYKSKAVEGRNLGELAQGRNAIAAL